MIYQKYLAIGKQRAVFADSEGAVKLLAGPATWLMNLHDRKMWDTAQDKWVEIPKEIETRLENALYTLYDDFKKNARAFNPFQHENMK